MILSDLGAYFWQIENNNKKLKEEEEKRNGPNCSSSWVRAPLEGLATPPVRTRGPVRAPGLRAGRRLTSSPAKAAGPGRGARGVALGQRRERADRRGSERRPRPEPGAWPAGGRAHGARAGGQRAAGAANTRADGGPPGRGRSTRGAPRALMFRGADRPADSGARAWDGAPRLPPNAARLLLCGAGAPCSGRARPGP